MPKKVRFFLKRSSKIEISGKQPIVIPFTIISALLLFVMILVSFFLLLRSDLFQINKIDLIGKIPDCATEDGIRLTTAAFGVSIFFFDTKLARKVILEKFYCLADVKLVKNYPDKLTIETFERIPIAAVSQIGQEPTLAIATSSAVIATKSASLLATPSSFFALDKEGRIFQNLSTTSALPKVYIAQNLQLAAKISQTEILWLLDFLEASKNFNLNFEEFIKTFDGELVGRSEAGIQLILSSETDAKKTASSLQAILRQAKIEGVNFKILDLRFEKPVIR